MQQLTLGIQPWNLAQGKACNMAKAGDVATFANYAKDALGSIDVWYVLRAHHINEMRLLTSHCPLIMCWACRINNAGSNGYKYKTLLESSDADLVSIVETNVLGVMLGCKEARAAGWLRPAWHVPYMTSSPMGTGAMGTGAEPEGGVAAVLQAIRVMRDQPSGGHIFNMDGAGADGNATPRFAAYGATKRGLVQLSRSLQVSVACCADECSKETPHFQ